MRVACSACGQSDSDRTSAGGGRRAHRRRRVSGRVRWVSLRTVSPGKRRCDGRLDNEPPLDRSITRQGA
jgi:hypothetical protein